MVTTNPDWPDWATKRLGSDGAARVTAAIAAAEARTAGEIVPVLVRRSSTVGHVPFLAFTLLALCLLLFDPAAYAAAAWGGPHWAWLGLGWGVAAGLALVAARFDVVQRLLTSRFDQSQQAELRAEVEFFENQIGKTRQSTGILIFVSLMERRAVVLADRAIAEKLDPGTWQEVVALTIAGVKRGDLAAGLVEAIARCGELLAPHFPIRPDDTNELRDRLIVKE